MTNTKWVALLIITIIAVGGYFFINNKDLADGDNLYTNKSYGYTINIKDGYEYRESNTASGNLFIYTPTSSETGSDNGLTVNIFAPTSGGPAPNATTQIGGQTAKVYTFTDELSLSRKSYQIPHNGMIYEITFAPSEDPRLEAMANSFRFTE